MSDKGLDSAKIMPTYSGFLIDKVNKIYEAWDRNQLETALGRAIRLVYFLPKELKDKMRDDKNKKSLRNLTKPIGSLVLIGIHGNRTVTVQQDE